MSIRCSTRNFWSLTGNVVSVDPSCKCIIFGARWEQVVASGNPCGCLFFPDPPAFQYRPLKTYLIGLHVIFTGTYYRTLDDKLRVLMPKRLRSSLAEDAGLYLTPGTNQCLELHTDESLQELANRAQQAKTSNQNVRSFSRLFYARAAFCEFDKQNRIRIPTESAQWAGLEKEIVLVGVGFNWEIWNPSAWEAYLAQNSDCFDGLVNQTFSLELSGGDSQAAKENEDLMSGSQTDGASSLQKPR